MDQPAWLYFELLLLLLLFLLPPTGGAVDMYRIGINYGRVANDLPAPSVAISLVKQLGFGAVKIFDANPEVLKALEGSQLSVSIMVPNQQIVELASSQASADSWVQNNAAAYYPATRITSINVGNEVLSDNSIQGTVWPSLVPAMENIYAALVKQGLANSIKVSTPLASDVLASSYPPSAGAFKSQIEFVIHPLLSFLSRTDSFYSANVYPYFAWSYDTVDISLDYALFGSSKVVTQDGSYGYTNLFDAMVDSVVAAMEKMGYGDLAVVISETGWPNDGATGATITNAAQYNNRLIDRMAAEQGTPVRPQRFIPTYIFALFNENEKPGAATEKHWGVAYSNAQPVYALGNDGLMDADKDEQGPSRAWCVANPGADAESLQKGMDFACSHANCSAIQPGKACFHPNTVSSHASYAFNSYWIQNKKTCHFSGAAKLSSANPSTCVLFLVMSNFVSTRLQRLPVPIFVDCSLTTTAGVYSTLFFFEMLAM